MDEIIGVPELGETGIDLYLKIRREDREGNTIKEEEARIIPEDALSLADDTKKHYLRTQNGKPFRTRHIKDFDLCLGNYVRYIYERTGAYSDEEYAIFCRSLLKSGIARRKLDQWEYLYFYDPDDHPELFYCYDQDVMTSDLVVEGDLQDDWPAPLWKWKDKRERCDEFLQKFFNLCLPVSLGQKYLGDFRNMLRAYDSVIREKHPVRQRYVKKLSFRKMEDRYGEFKTQPMSFKKGWAGQAHADDILKFFETALEEELKSPEPEAQQADEKRT